MAYKWKKYNVYDGAEVPSFPSKIKYLEITFV